MVLLTETSVSKKYEFVLDLDKGYQSTSLTLIQASNNVRKFEVQLTKEELPFNLTNCIVKAMYLKSDDTIVFDTVKVVDALEGHIQVGLTEQCLSSEGRVRCEIVVINVLEESFITFPTFVFKAKASLFASGMVESSDEFLALTQAIVKVENFEEVGQAQLEKLEQFLEVGEGKVDEFSILHNLAQDTINDIVDLEQDAHAKVTDIANKQQEGVRLVEDVMAIKDETLEVYEDVASTKLQVNDLHQQVSNYENVAKAKKLQIESMAQDIRSVEMLVSDTLVEVVALKDSAVADGQQIANTKNEADKHLKTISTQTTNANNWSASVNNVLSNSQNRYNEIVKLKGDSLNVLSDIIYHSSVAELELERMKELFDEKMREFENRFNELMQRLQ